MRGPEDPERTLRAQEAFRREAERRASASDLPLEGVIPLLAEAVRAKPFVIEYMRLGYGMPVAKAVEWEEPQGGRQVRVQFNIDHSFVLDHMLGDEQAEDDEGRTVPVMSYEARMGVEVVIASLVISELEADDPKQWVRAYHEALGSRLDTASQILATMSREPDRGYSRR